MFNKEYNNDHLWWNVSFSWHHIFILFKNMSFKCPFCPRTFSQRTAYSQHVQVCLRKVEVEEEESNSETHSIDITQDINESDDNELMEYEPFQEAAQDTSFSSMESTYSNLLSEISIMSYGENIELEESEVLEESEESEKSEIFEEAKEPEPETLTEFSRSEEHTSELQSQSNLVCRLLLEKKNKNTLTSCQLNIP